MKKVLCTFPGRYGDLLWALPTVRAISQYYGVPVDLQIGGEFESIAPLIGQQPYIRRVIVDDRWTLTPPDEWQAPRLEHPDQQHDHIHHLGYRGWPDRPLAQYIYGQVSSGWLPPLDLETPWIVHHGTRHSYHFPWCFGFTEAHFELKFGLIELLRRGYRTSTVRTSSLHPVSICSGERWETEGRESRCRWDTAAALLSCSQFLLADCSALHVLAVAMGKQVLLCEPMEARWNDIFYPLGKSGRVELILGNDGKPTFDARHVHDAVKAALHRSNYAQR